MPVIFEKQIDTAKKLAVWHITESEAELFSLHGYLSELTYSKKRNLEQAVSRILLNYLLDFDAHINLSKDEFGKPYLSNSGISVSFSHSRQMVACMISMEGESVGIDIELIRESITGIAHKFCTTKDSTPLPGILDTHLIWGGKEVLYKIYAKKELDFIDHLSVWFDKSLDVFILQNNGSGFGNIHKGKYSSKHHLGFEILGDFMLVWGS